MKGQREEIRSDDCPGGLQHRSRPQDRPLSDAVRVPAGYEQIVTAVRSEVIKHEPTFMLGVLSGLVWPQIRVEIEVTAVPPARG